MSWAREHNPFIERMKNLDFPGIDVDVAGADTVSVIGWDQTGSGDFIPLPAASLLRGFASDSRLIRV
jgi:hypothetical protein